MGRPLKERTEVVPAYPEPYIRQSSKVAARKRGRPRKLGRPRKNKQATRASPSKRAGVRWRSVSVTEDTYFMLQEVSAFYNVALGVYLYSLILPAFDHAYQESLTLERIAKTREKEKNETPNTDDVPRRTHF